MIIYKKVSIHSILNNAMRVTIISIFNDINKIQKMVIIVKLEVKTWVDQRLLSTYRLRNLCASQRLFVI